MLRRDALRASNPPAYKLIQNGYHYFLATKPELKKSWDCFNEAYRKHGSLKAIPPLYRLEKTLGLSLLAADMPKVASSVEGKENVEIQAVYCNYLTDPVEIQKHTAEILKQDNDPFVLYALSVRAARDSRHDEALAMLRRGASMGDTMCCTMLARSLLGPVENYREVLHWHQQALINCDFVEETEILKTSWVVPEVYNDDCCLSLLLSCLDRFPATFDQPSCDFLEKKEIARSPEVKVMSRVDNYLGTLLSIHFSKLTPKRRDELMMEMHDPSIIASQVQLDHLNAMKQAIKSSLLLTTDVFKSVCTYFPGAINPLINVV